MCIKTHPWKFSQYYPSWKMSEYRSGMSSHLPEALLRSRLMIEEPGKKRKNRKQRGFRICFFRWIYWHRLLFSSILHTYPSFFVPKFFRFTSLLRFSSFCTQFIFSFILRRNFFSLLKKGQCLSLLIRILYTMEEKAEIDHLHNNKLSSVLWTSMTKKCFHMATFIWCSAFFIVKVNFLQMNFLLHGSCLNVLFNCKSVPFFLDVFFVLSL